jgi:hypothetical protein
MCVQISERLLFDDAEAPSLFPGCMERDSAAYDSALLSVIPFRRIKVAMTLFKAAELLGVVPTDSTCDYLVGRLKLLVVDGHVEAFGNIDRWRFSEVCKR